MAKDLTKAVGNVLCLMFRAQCSLKLCPCLIISFSSILNGQTKKVCVNCHGQAAYMHSCHTSLELFFFCRQY